MQQSPEFSNILGVNLISNIVVIYSFIILILSCEKNQNRVNFS